MRYSLSSFITRSSLIDFNKTNVLHFKIGFLDTSGASVGAIFPGLVSPLVAQTLQVVELVFRDRGLPQSRSNHSNSFIVSSKERLIQHHRDTRVRHKNSAFLLMRKNEQKHAQLTRRWKSAGTLSYEKVWSHFYDRQSFV